MTNRTTPINGKPRHKRPLSHQSRTNFIAPNDKGEPVFHIRLNDGQVAIMDCDDAEALMRQNLLRRCYVNTDGKGHRYVNTTLPGKGNTAVARLIMQPPRGWRVIHADGNPLNLRRANLIVVQGFAKGQERHLLDKGDG